MKTYYQIDSRWVVIGKTLCDKNIEGFWDNYSFTITQTTLIPGGRVFLDEYSLNKILLPPNIVAAKILMTQYSTIKGDTFS